MNRKRLSGVPLILLLLATVPNRYVAGADPLPGTQPLTWEGDIASRLVEGADRFLLTELQQSIQQRAAFWHRDVTSAAAYEKSVQPNRRRLAHILGVRDPRMASPEMELVATTTQPALVGRTDEFKAFAVRWPVLPRV